MGRSTEKVELMRTHNIWHSACLIVGFTSICTRPFSKTSAKTCISWVELFYWSKFSALRNIPVCPEYKNLISVWKEAIFIDLGIRMIKHRKSFQFFLRFILAHFPFFCNKDRAFFCKIIKKIIFIFTKKSRLVQRWGLVGGNMRNPSVRCTFCCYFIQYTYCMAQICIKYNVMRFHACSCRGEHFYLYFL